MKRENNVIHLEVRVLNQVASEEKIKRPSQWLLDCLDYEKTTAEETKTYLSKTSILSVATYSSSWITR